MAQLGNDKNGQLTVQGQGNLCPGAFFLATPKKNTRTTKAQYICSP
jgi:hypothetical protein